MIQRKDPFRRKVGDRSADVERFLVCLWPCETEISYLNPRVGTRCVKEDILRLHEIGQIGLP